MSEKLNFVNKYITNYILDNFPELSRFKIMMNEDALFFHNIKGGYKHILYIGLGHLTYPQEQVVHSGFQCWCEVTYIENLLIELLSKHKLYVKLLFPTIEFEKFTVKNFEVIRDSFSQLNEYDLYSNKEKLEKLCEHYKEAIEHHFIPFWEKYSNIQYINNEIINKVTEEEVNNYLPDMGNFKKLIIMKLCSNPNYNDYKNYITRVGEKALIEDENKYKPYADLFKELTEILEKKN